MKIKILDCTLRDGGYINNWDFSSKEMYSILKALENSNIDIIECGYLNTQKGKSKNSTLFDSLNTIDLSLSKIETNAKKVVMINLGDYAVTLLKPKNETLIDGIRLAFHKKNLDIALREAKYIIELGYDLYFQPMVTKNYKDIEFLSMIEEINKLNPYAFYIVDSFGSMTLDEFNKYLVLSHNNLNTAISLGYHSHNNMQLAFSNAVSMCSANMQREIIIDASIYGIGRGAGNLNTELIADYLNSSFAENYNILPLLETIDEFLNSLMVKKPWGFSPAQYLSASFDCHPNYATYLINKNTKHIVGVRNILEKLPIEKRNSFDEKYIENLYMESIFEIKTEIKGFLEIPKDKRVLLVASGKSVNEYRERIENKAKNDSYLTIALNHKPSFVCDYYFFSNQKRFDEFNRSIHKDKIVITSNISTKMEIDIVLDFKKFTFVDKNLVTNVAIVVLNHLIAKRVSTVEIAGLDGYDILRYNNYNYSETSNSRDEKTLLKENNILEYSLKRLSKKILIEFVTPSIFENSIELKIIGIISAIYKPSRFEEKPLCIKKDISMIKRTFIQANKSNLLDKLVVSTDSEKIKNYCENENIPIVMMSESCLTGIDSIAEIAEHENYDLYVNIQGDEPVIDPISIDEIVDEFKKYGDKYIAYNLYKTIDDESEVKSPTIIKTIINEKDELMYMSRFPAPFNKSNEIAKYKKQICVYGFTKKALKVFISREKTLNEQYENIEILRFLDMGYGI